MNRYALYAVAFVVFVTALGLWPTVRTLARTGAEAGGAVYEVGTELTDAAAEVKAAQRQAREEIEEAVAEVAVEAMTQALEDAEAEAVQRDDPQLTFMYGLLKTVIALAFPVGAALGLAARFGITPRL